VFPDHLDGMKDSEQLTGVEGAETSSPIDEGGPDQPEESTGEGSVGDGAEAGRCASGFLTDRGTQLSQMSGNLLRACRMLNNSLPLRFRPENRLA
jgi:hypothetical protein